MNYKETCEYLYNQMPMFERQGASGYKEGLSTTLALDEHLGHPHLSYKTIHVGGTNGKGSVSHTIAAVLQECGYRVGLYTSPHLVDFRERIRINGKPISQQYVVNFVEEHRSFFEPLHPSFFEVTTAMAFMYFKEMNVDIAVIEVGLGGRLDCTNIIQPLVSVITNISFDHTQFLGDTLAKIAGEKAGIIKTNTPVVIGETNAETRPVFEKTAREKNAPIVFADDDPQVVSAVPLNEGGMRYHLKFMGKLEGDLGGIYQKQNMNTALFALEEVRKLGYLASAIEGKTFDRCRYELKSGISNVAKLTGLRGRWETVNQTPKVVCDTGHNVGGWMYLSRQLANVQCQQMHIIFGMVDDKDIDKVLDLLPKHAKFYFTKAQTKRALNENVVMEKAKEHGIEGNAYHTVNEAYKAAYRSASANDFIFVGGSSYIVGDFLKNCI